MYSQNKQNQTVGELKSLAASPLFLVGAIGYSVYVLLQFINCIIGGANISIAANRILQDSMYSSNSSFTNGYISGYTGGYMITMMLQLIPAILILTGLWLTFASAKNKKGSGISVTGISMIRVIAVIQLVFVCIGVVFVEGVCIYVMSDLDSIAGYRRLGDRWVSFLILGMIVIAGVAVIQILFYVKLCSTIRVMKETAITGRADDQISLYAEVYCYMAGGSSAITAMVSLSEISAYGFLANAGMATAYICFAIFLRKYRNCMKMLLSGAQQQYFQPYYDPAQQSYQQPYQEPAQQSYQQPYQEPAQQLYQQPYQEPAQQSYQQPYQEPVQQSYQNYAQSSAYDSESETTVLPYYNETSVLSGQFMSDGRMCLMRMTRQKTGETICISKPSFWIGKDAANVDYCITDNTAVSRRHALITIQNGRCCIRDNHSTNRLFINGQAVQPDIDTPLSDGDRVRMGDEEFIVAIS